MSMCHWMCKGIGFEQGALVPFLHGPTLAEAMEEHFPDILPLSELENKYGFSKLTNEEQVNLLLDEYIAELDGQLVELIIQMDDKYALIAENNGEGSHFLLYTPRYPWQGNGGLKSQQEVEEYILRIARLFCRDDVTEEQVHEIIDLDISEVGCG